jgi:hypothetical protein
VIDGRLILGDFATATRLREPGFELHHPDLVNGANVAYGGNIRFHNSTVSYWDRDSGHYEPNRLGDRAESECIREIIEQAPGWSLGTLPPETLIDFS